MLILGRDLGESIMIGDNIQVTVKSYENDMVELEIQTSDGIKTLTGKIEKDGASITLNDGIMVGITLPQYGALVGVGTSASKEISVHRREYWEQIQRGEVQELTVEQRNAAREKKKRLKLLVKKPVIVRRTIGQSYVIGNEQDIRVTLVDTFASSNRVTLKIDFQHNYMTHPITSLFNRLGGDHKQSMEELVRDDKVSIEGRALTVTLKREQFFYFSEQLSIVANKIDRKNVKFAIHAPAETTVLRSKVQVDLPTQER